MSAFPDTGPQPDGRRTEDQWLNAMQEDVGLIRYNIARVKKETNKALYFALARKEARRLESDIERMAQEVYGIEVDELSKQRI